MKVSQRAPARPWGRGEDSGNPTGFVPSPERKQNACVEHQPKPGEESAKANQRAPAKPWGRGEDSGNPTGFVPSPEREQNKCDDATRNLSQVHEDKGPSPMRTRKKHAETMPSGTKPKLGEESAKASRRASAKP